MRRFSHSETQREASDRAAPLPPQVVSGKAVVATSHEGVAGSPTESKSSSPKTVSFSSESDSLSPKGGKVKKGIETSPWTNASAYGKVLWSTLDLLQRSELKVSEAQHFVIEHHQKMAEDHQGMADNHQRLVSHHEGMIEHHQSMIEHGRQHGSRMEELKAQLDALFGARTPAELSWQKK